MSEQKNAVELNDSELEKAVGAGGNGGGLQVGDWCTGRLLYPTSWLTVDYLKTEYKITEVSLMWYGVRVYFFKHGIAGGADSFRRTQMNSVDRSTAQKVDMPDWAVGLPE